MVGEGIRERQGRHGVVSLPEAMGLLTFDWGGLCQKMSSMFRSTIRILLTVVGLAVPTLSLAKPQVEYPKRILFIGNSYTYNNDLPHTLQEMVRSAGLPVPKVKSNYLFGKRLIDHVGSRVSMRLIDQGNWDLVVLQGMSLETVFAKNSKKDRDDFVLSAQELCERVRQQSPKARIIFFQTWARHQDFFDYYKSLFLEKSPATAEKDYNDWAVLHASNSVQQQQFISESYDWAAKENEAEVARVGEAWARHYQQPKMPIRLHDRDSSHPSPAGTYLAALAFYKQIYQPEVIKISYRGKVNPAEAAYLQSLVE